MNKSFSKAMVKGIWCVEDLKGARGLSWEGVSSQHAIHPTQCGRVVKGLGQEGPHRYSNEGPLRSCGRTATARRGF